MGAILDEIDMAIVSESCYAYDYAEILEMANRKDICYAIEKAYEATKKQKRGS